MGNRWGPEGPPAEAYSRVTNPERFAPLLDVGAQFVDRLEFSSMWYARKTTASILGLNGTRPARRFTPSNRKAGALTVGFSKFPGIKLRLGHWFVLPIRSAAAMPATRRLRKGKRSSIAL